MPSRREFESLLKSIGIGFITDLGVNRSVVSMSGTIKAGVKVTEVSY